MNDATSNDGAFKTFWGHLDDLRGTLFKSLIALAITFHVALAFANRILAVITWPLRRVTDNYGELSAEPECYRFIRTLSEAGVLRGSGRGRASDSILRRSIRIARASPQGKTSVMAELCRRRRVVYLRCGRLLLFIVPRTVWAFIEASHWLGIEPRWTIDSYISFVSQFTLMTGLTFEMPLVILILVRLGVVSYATVRKGRKVFILLAFVIGAFLAPPNRSRWCSWRCRCWYCLRSPSGCPGSRSGGGTLSAVTRESCEAWLPTWPRRIDCRPFDFVEGSAS